MVPVTYQQDVEKVLEKAQDDQKIKEIVERQAQDTVSDIINDTNNFNQNALTSEMIQVFDVYADEIETITNKEVPKERLVQEFEMQVSKYNLTKSYEKVISKVHNKLSAKQLKFLKQADNLNSNLDSYKKQSLISLFVVTVILLLLNPKGYIFLARSSMLIVFFKKISMPLVIKVFMNILKLEEIKHSISINHVVFKQGYIYLAVLLIIGLLVSTIQKIKKKRNQNIAYD